MNSQETDATKDILAEWTALLLAEFLKINACKVFLLAATNGDNFAEMITYAGNLGHIDLVRLCVENGINVNIQDKLGNTSLLCACSRNFEDIVSFLLEHSADVNIQNNDGETALMWASRFNCRHNVETLLNYNADTELKDKRDKTALDLATIEGNQRIVVE